MKIKALMFLKLEPSLRTSRVKRLKKLKKKLARKSSLLMLIIFLKMDVVQLSIWMRSGKEVLLSNLIVHRKFGLMKWDIDWFLTNISTFGKLFLMQNLPWEQVSENFEDPQKIKEIGRCFKNLRSKSSVERTIICFRSLV